MREGKISLLDALVAGRQLYGSIFNPHITLKALSYYKDGNLETLPSEVKERLCQAAAGVDFEELVERLKSSK